MIEIVYENTAEEEREEPVIRLPKNIRQIGTPSGPRRIYMEDYVFTYLNQLAKPSNTYSRGAILLGEFKKSGAGEVLFINGAVEAQNLEFDLDETVFTNETWSEIYENIKQYFPDLSVVGWFLSRLGFSTSVNEKIIRTHMDNFSGRDKTLYIIDALEGEDAFYLFEDGTLRKQPGYYIYYTKNEAMQNYIMMQNEAADENEREATRKDEQLINNYRQLMDRKKHAEDGQNPHLLYVASTMLTVTVLALGITVLNSYDKMKSMETALNRVQLAMEQDREIKETGSTNIYDMPALPAEDTGKESTASDADSLQQTTGEEMETPEEAENTKAEPVMGQGVPVYYTVQDGDTITSISIKMYHSAKYVQQIVDANALGNGNQIYIGQKILIPAITN